MPGPHGIAIFMTAVGLIGFFAVMILWNNSKENDE